MKFNEKYPPHAFSPYTDVLSCGIFRVADGREQPCVCCKELTLWVDTLWDSTNISTCSEECRLFLWNEFFVSYRSILKKNNNI